MQESKDFALDSGILDFLHLEKPEVLFLCDPNNPTGRLADPKLIEAILERCRDLKIRLFLDECFLDLTKDGVSRKNDLARYPELFLLKAFTIKQCITGRGSAPKEQVAALVSSMLTIERPPRRLDATDGMAVALCHHFMSSNPLNGALGEDRFKGLGGGRKAASAKGSSSWERFLKDNPQREIRQTPRTPQKTNHKPTK